MNQKEILGRLRCGADVAHREDVHLHVGPEICKAAADLIESLGRTATFGWQSDVSGPLVSKPDPARDGAQPMPVFQPTLTK